MAMQNINLKTNPDQLERAILRRFIPLEQVGLSWPEYQQLVLENNMPWPNQLKEGVLLTLSEVIWLKMTRGLKSYNFSRKVIATFSQWVMREVWFYESEESFNRFINGAVVTSLDLAKHQIISFFLLDLIILEVLKDKRDTKLHFNQNGQLFYSHNALDAEQASMNGPIVSFSLHQLLVELAGKANVPVLTNFLTEVTSAEAEVLMTVRQPQYTSIMVEKAAPGGNHIWDIVAKEIGVATESESEKMRKDVKRSFGKLVLDGLQSSHMPYELYRRKRCW